MADGPPVMSISTPLDDGVLLFHSMHAQEELGRLSAFEISLLSEEPDVDINAVLGQRTTVHLTLPDDSVRHFNGFVTRFSAGGRLGRYHIYQARVSPWLWFLTRTADCRIFQELTVPDILRQVFDDQPHASVAFELTDSYRKWNYCVQYRETDFNFVSRLMEQEGISYYFRHEDGKHTMVLTDSTDMHLPTKGYEKLIFIPPGTTVRPEFEHVSAWDFSREVQPDLYVHDDYDLERPSVELKTKKVMPGQVGQGKFEIYDYPGHYVQTADGDNYAAIRMEEFGTQVDLARAFTNAGGVTVGSLFTLEQFSREDQNREHLIVASSYDLVFSGYEGLPQGEPSEVRCSFSAMPSSQQFRSRRLTPKPFVQGPQTAVVVGPAGDEIFTDDYGRVKVQFHWDRYGKKDENSSCWIRVSQMWAGKGWGSVSTPRIGHEVIVDFLEGDPDQPIVIGSVHNAENKPPHTGVVSGLKSNTHKGKGFNQMTMEDTAGKEKITIHGQYDMGTTVQHDQTNTVNNDFTETIKKNATISITEGKLSHDVVAGTATYHVQGAITEIYDDTQTTTVANDITIVCSGGPIAVASDAAHVYIKGTTSIQLVVGAASIWMDTNGQIAIKGVDVSINGESSVTIGGGVIHSEAKGEHQTKGAIVLSEAGGTNTVKGSMVMLN